MNSTDFLRSKKEPLGRDDLIGTWRLVRSEGDLDTGEGVTMEFRSNGELDYCVHERDRTEIMKLVFRVDGNSIVTDQPSHPSENRTAFSIDHEGVLLLDYGTVKAWFEKETRS